MRTLPLGLLLLLWACEDGPAVSCDDCLETACVASCEGRECGDDGCSGSCGSCSTGQSCNDGLCLAEGCECRAGMSTCLASAALHHCSDGCHWSRFDCEALCLEREYAGSDGCQADDSGAEACYCRHFAGWGTSCQPDFWACPEGSQTCLSSGQASACSKLCESDTDCENVAPGEEGCVAIGTGRKLCAVFCQEAADCLPGTSCVDIGGTWGVCLGR